MKINLSFILLFLCGITFKLIAQPTMPLSDFVIGASTSTVYHANGLCSTPKSANIIDGWFVSVSSASNCGITIVNTGASNGHVNFFGGLGGGLIYATFGSDDGSEFAIKQIVMSVSSTSGTSMPLLYQGYKNGSPVTGASLTANTPSSIFPSTVVVTFSTITAFQDVDDIRVSPSSQFNSNFQIWSISLGTATPVVSCPTPTLTLSGSTPVSCNGGSNGTATMSASGGSPFTYTWSPSGGSAANATGLSAMTYTCNVTNSCGATASQTVSITQPISALNTSTFVINNLCNGGSIGTATITASGGTSPYTYMWSTGATTSVISSRPAGAYTGTVTDANGCTSTKVATITQPSALVTTTAVTNDFPCNGVSTGAATITASGGTSPYTYIWSTGATTSVISGRPPGVYTGTVTDANGCTSSKAATIIQDPSAFNSTITVTNVLCNGANTGAATITTTGGTSPYTYAWSTGGGTSVKVGLPAGVYTGTVIDGNGCKSVNVFTITQPASALNTATSVTNLLCNGASTGAATLTASGGTGAYTYLWSTGATTSVISNRPAGAYTGTVTDANGCASSKVATITQPSALVTNTAVSNVLCNGGATGSASITSSGGTGAYTYIWSSGATTSVISGLTAGVYTGTVTDANGCTSTKVATITEPAALILSSSSFSNSTGSNGSAGVVVTGGSGGYTYSWSPGNPTGQGTASISALAAGTYTCLIKDVNNCSVTATFTISSLTPGAALNFDGVNDRVSIANNIGSSFSLELWFKTSTPSAVGTFAYQGSGLIDSDVGGFANDFILSLLNNRIAFYDGANNVNSVGTTVLTDGNWHHVAVTRQSGAQTIIYVDGLQELTATAGVAALNANSNIYLGANINAGVFSNISLDEVRIWNRVLCLAEIQNNKNAEIATSANSLIANYHFNQGFDAGSNTGVTSLIDASGNNNNGTLTNFALSGTTSNWISPGAVTSGSNAAAFSSPLSTTITTSNIACNGGANGSATVTASGGAPYTYSWTPSGGTNSVATNLAAGNYTVRVTNVCGTSTNATLSITQPPALTTSTAVTNVVCFGNSTGAATVSGSGGTSPYTYLWSGAQTTSVISGQLAGVKTVTLTDANSCTIVATANITQPASALATSTAVTNVLCFGNSTGAATITASGGTSPYTYLWSGAQTTSVITGQLAGIRTVTITDANSCTTTNSVSITEPGSGMTTSTAAVNVLCFGNSTGAATVTASGGAGSYSYAWSTGATTSVITTLNAGVRTVTVTDASSCTSTNTVTITQPAANTVSINILNNVSCFGGNNGVLTATGMTGTGPFTFMWSPGTRTTATYTSAAVGIYTILVSDANACEATATATITQPTALVTNTAVTNILCFGNSTGAATVTASGGTSPYNYVWSGAQTTSVISGQLAGVKTVTITDANSCTMVATANITQPASALATSTAVTNVLCFGNSTGAATVTASGGTSPYTYAWSSGATTSVISTLNAGVRTVTVTDASSCTSTNTVTITQPAANTVSINILNNVSCFGGNNGVLTATGMTGTGPFTFMWSPGTRTTATYTSAAVGVYTILVSDANTCEATATATITQPTALVTNTSVTNILCFGNSTGAATVTTSGGTSPYSYVWSGAQTTSVISGQLAGVNTITVTDANSCTMVATANITQPASALTTATAVTNVLCFGNSTGASTVTASGGTLPYTYLWSGAQTTSVISGQLAGARTVTVTDANNCTTTNSVNITQPGSGMTTSTAAVNVLCFGNSTGAATVTATGGSGAYNYLWSTGATTSVITGLNAGVRTVTVSDASSCTSTNTVTITQPTSALATSTTVTNILCFGNSTGAATVTATGGTSPYSYLWSGAQTTSVISGQLAGVNTVTVTDANSCTILATANITQPAGALATSTAVTNVLCFGNSTGAATVTASGGTSPYTYLWSGAQTTSVISGQLAGARTVTVADANSCTTTNSVSITQPGSGMTTSTAVVNVLCFGNSTGSATVTATGGSGTYSYAWSTGATTSVITTLNAGIRTVTVSDASSCTSTNTITITQPVSALTTTISSFNPLCNGGVGSSTISASGGTGAYSIVWSTAATSSVIASLVPGVYTATVTDVNSCVSTKTATITTPPALSLTANSNTASICSGNTATLTASASGGTGILTYTWTNGLANASQSVNPSSSTVYTIQVTDANTCTILQTVSLTVNITPTLSVSSYTICSGATASIIATGADTYTWNTGSNSNSIAVSPTSNTVYIVNGQSTAGCSATAKNASVTVSTAPSIVVNSSTICTGQSATLIASGVTTYSWNNGATTSSIVVSPNSNTVYIVNGTLTGCPVPAINNSTVDVIPVPTIAATSGTICEGQSFVIVPSGANTYTINTGSFTVNPTSNTSYSVSGTGTNGCVSTTSAVTTITVHPNPTISVSSGSICEGQTYTILPSGASTYTFSNGSNTISPLLTTSYSVTGTSSVGCAGTNTASGTVTVYVNPTITVPSGSICSGQTFTLNPSGANTYTYSSTNNTVTPITTTSYSIIGTSTAGCVSTSSGIATVSVSASPTITVNSGTICSGQSFTLIGNGANTYTYSSGNVVSPVNTDTYSVVGTSTAGCLGTNTAIATVSVFALPQLTVASQSICNGATATLTALGANTYTWSNLQNTQSITVNPVLTTTYSAIGTSTDGCVSSSVTATVTVTNAPSITVNSSTICNGFSATLTASGVDTYSWNTGPTTSIIVVNPTSSTNYTVTGFQNGCSVMATNTTAVLVNALPNVSITSIAAICNGKTATLSASGADTYTWSNNQNGNTTTVSPSASSNFSVIGTNSTTGCSNSANFNLTVYPLPTLSISGNFIICYGNTSSLTASGAQTYTWNNGLTGSLVNLTPTVSTDYTVTGTDINGCENNTTTTVSVTTLPTLVVSQGTVCAGKTYTIVPSGATSYTYSSGSAAVTPSATTIYTVSGSNAENCINSTTVSVVVFANPTINAGPDLTIKIYDSFTLNATSTGATSYTWSPASMVQNPNILQATGIGALSSNFTVIASSSVGCTSSATVNVSVNTDNLEISNYMSPNGDGVNDKWKVNNTYFVKDYSVEVKDQWGNSVFNKSNNYDNEWDGNDPNGRPVPDGVYYYVFLQDGVVKHSGSITLLR